MKEQTRRIYIPAKAEPFLKKLLYRQTGKIVQAASLFLKNYVKCTNNL